MTTCAVCSRPLRHPVSIERRHGPECDPDPEERRRVAERLRTTTATGAPSGRPRRRRGQRGKGATTTATAGQLGLFETPAPGNDCDESDDEAHIAGGGCTECPGGCGVW